MKIFRTLILVVFFSIVLTQILKPKAIFLRAPSSNTESSPNLHIYLPDKEIIFSRDELLKMGTEVITVLDPAFKKDGKPTSQTYTAVRFSKILDQAGIKIDLKDIDDASVSFKCTDGYSAQLKVSNLINTSASGSVAYIAIENPNDKWQNLSAKINSAGPYYLVWVDPDKSNVVETEWPYMVMGFNIIPSFEKAFPKVLVDDTLPENALERKGFRAFKKTCFACHKINGQGPSAAASPDLNIPMNPTEYFADGIIEKLVRNPKQVREWKGMGMPALDQNAISDEDLAAVVQYLRHMKNRR